MSELVAEADPAVDAELRAALDAHDGGARRDQDHRRGRHPLRPDARHRQRRRRGAGDGRGRRADRPDPRRSSGRWRRSSCRRSPSRAPTASTTPRRCSSRAHARAWSSPLAALAAAGGGRRRTRTSAVVPRTAGGGGAGRRRHRARHATSSAPEPFEARPGGAATSRQRRRTPTPSRTPRPTCRFARELDFKVGNGLFRKLWVTAPASTRVSDGLGPLFNARACQSCHLKDGRGHPPAGPDDPAVGMFLRLSVPASRATCRRSPTAIEDYIATLPEPTYGGQLQNFAIAGHAGRGPRWRSTYAEAPVTLAGGETVTPAPAELPRRRPRLRAARPRTTMLSPRVAPQMIGLGLLEAVPADGHPGARRPGRRRRRRHQRPAERRLVGGVRPADARPLRPQGRPADDPRPGGRRLRRRHRHLDARCIPTAGATAPRREAGCRAAPDGGAPEADDTVLDLVDLLQPQPRGPGAARRRTTREVLRRQGACSTRRAAPPATTPKFVTAPARGPAGAELPADLALHRPAAARHGRGPGRPPARGARRRARVAHRAALGHRADRDRHRPRQLPARRPRAHACSRRSSGTAARRRRRATASPRCPRPTATRWSASWSSL